MVTETQDKPKSEDVCICGHNIQEHAANGTCLIEDCRCAGFEADEN